MHGVAARNPPADEGTAPVEIRQAAINTLVRKRGFTRVSELAERFGVSEVTVRADLAALEIRGRLRRVRGGAVPASALLTESPFEVSAQQRARQKQLIGEAAARLVSPGDTLVIDVGSTTTALARALVNRTDLHDVTVFTNALNVALALEQADGRIAVVVTGGSLRPMQHSLVNPLGTLLLEQITATLAFLGCNGVDPRGGVTNINLPEAEIKRAMLRAARRPVVLADASKLGVIELARICDVDEVDLVITDASADPAVVSELVALGCPVEQAS